MADNVPIAVVGMACRLPGGADSPEKLWSMLADGRDGRTEVPKSRWDWKSFYHKHPGAREGLSYSHGYFLEQDLSLFDAPFFGIPISEASGMDPQQRLLLEVAYEALENAGIPMEALRGSDTSVHMATFARDYDRMGYIDTSQIHKSHITGVGDAILSNRLSYVLDLKGPSNTLDTGCSGSLVALHQACLSLRANEATIAITGGSQLSLSPDQPMALSTVGIINPDARCYTFDDRGNGYARGEGVGVVVLKRLDRAIADGDPIHAVIAGTGVNHDGRTAGIYLPNADAQEELARSVYAKAGLDPRQVLYIEAHGTGTEVGDTAEITGISRVFGREAGRESDLVIGSVKTNIGHLESTSGVASLIKAILVLKKNQIPPNLNFINPKPSLRLEERGIKIPLELQPLTPQDFTGPRRVSVNSFGYGGANAHAILEAVDLGEAYVNDSAGGQAGGLPHGDDKIMQTHIGVTTITNGVPSANKPAAVPRLIILSANCEKSLNQIVSNLQEWLSEEAGNMTSLRDLAYTLGIRRSKLPWRCSATATTAQGLVDRLRSTNLRKVKATTEFGLAFVFTGQGSQWFAMGRELVLVPGVFKESIQAANKVLKSLGCEWDLVHELLQDKDKSKLGDASLSQPASTALQIALVDLLASLGIVPQAVCGHSSGEVAAAYAAGALGLEAAMQVAYYRGICTAEAKNLNTIRGAMLAVGLGEIGIGSYIAGLSRGKVVVACVNSPDSTTISGDEDAIEELRNLLDLQGIFNRRLLVDSAYHSPHMMVVADRCHSMLQIMQHSVPHKDIAYFSSVTASRKHHGFGPAYWIDNFLGQVKFSEAAKLTAEHLAATCEHSQFAANVLVEIGPHSALMGPLRQSLSQVDGGSFKYTYIPCLVRNQSAFETVLALTGTLFEVGYPIQLDTVQKLGEEPDIKPPKVLSTLPSYAWDHTSSYWHESRLSKGHRFRPFPYHDLLGLLDMSSTLKEARWRYHIGPKSLPWLKDHVVDGFVIFSGAGYMTMVIEAMRQLFQIRESPGEIKKIILKDLLFIKALVIETQDIELQLTLSPEQNHDDNVWERYRICSFNADDNTWNEHANGIARIETSVQPDEVEGTREEELASTAALSLLESIQAGSSTVIGATEFYADLEKSANVFGATFQGVKQVKVGKSHGIATIVVPDLAATMPSEYMQPHLIHPATLDAVNHLQILLFRRECTTAPVMPIKISELSISTDLDTAAEAELIAAVTIRSLGTRTAVGDVLVFQKGDGGALRPVFRLAGCRLQAVGKETGASILSAPGQNINYRFEWQPDVDGQTQDDFLRRLTRLNLFDVEYPRTSTVSAKDQILLNEKVATIYIRDGLDQLKQAGIRNACNPHLTKLLEWMMHWARTETKRVLGGMTNEDEARIMQASSENTIGRVLQYLGPRLSDIIAGEADPVELLVKEDLLSRLYSEGPFLSSYAQMDQYLSMLVHKYPKLRVLEIGAGAGCTTAHFMKSIDRDGRLLLDHFTYTDISESLFAKAKSRLSKWLDRVEFKTLDISQDPLRQGFEAESYDVIVAANVFHATPSLESSMKNARKLLRSGGRMVVIEMTRPTADLTMILGTLEGWWMSEGGRKESPLLSVPQWDSLFRLNGFSGTEIVTPDHVGGHHVCDMMVTRAVDVAKPSTTPRPSRQGATLILGHPSPIHQKICDLMSLELTSHGVACTQQPLHAIEGDLETLHIIVDSAENALLLSPSSATFERVKNLMTKRTNMLWISFCEESSASGVAPANNLINGMARVARLENPGLRCITADIQDNLSSVMPQAIRKLAEVCEMSFWPPSEDQRAEEWEYVFRDGSLELPRVVPDAAFADYVDGLSGAADTVECHYLNPQRPLMLEVQTPGLLSSLRFVDNPTVQGALRPEQIQLEARAFGINFKDVFIAMGQMEPGLEMVSEVVGIVSAVGSEVQSLFKVGDRATGIFGAPFGSQVRVNGKASVTLPESMSMAEGASITTVFYTAWYCLTQTSRLRKGQTILIHAASGGVGQAAIQLAKHIGATIFATVGSAAKRQLIQEQYGLPESHIFSSHSRTFKDGILRLTEGKGVDVVLNSLSGEMLMTSWDCIAQFGTFVEIGKTDIYRHSKLSMLPFDRQATFASVDMTHLFRRYPEEFRIGLQEIMSMFERGILRPVHPVTTYSIDRIDEAFRLIAARKHVGKLVLLADETTIVKASLPRSSPLQLRQDGTYVIGGGLGDLGRRMCRFLASKGAGHIVTLSRRDPYDPLYADLRADIENSGSKLYTIQCDITDDASIRQAQEMVATLPPVRGIIQAALVLRDHPLEFMTTEDYTACLRPKVEGTINIHRAFCSPETTDFFITLSSIASVLGHASQANYSAGNAFQDAFAHANHGTSRTKYMSINVGAIEGSEQISRAVMQRDPLAHLNIRGICFDEFFTTLEYVMGSQSGDGSAQCIMGLVGKGLETTGDTVSMTNHLFDLIPCQLGRNGADNGDSGGGRANAQQAVQQVIEQATSVGEAEKLIQHELLAKLAAFLGGEVAATQPISRLGLDSLISIELKNWAVHTFKILLQTSELSGSRSVIALSQLIASRMNLHVKQDVENTSASPQAQSLPQQMTASRVAGLHSDGKLSGHGWDCCKHSKSLLKQPLPDLDDALDFLLDSTHHLHDPELLEEVKNDIQTIRAANSPGRRVFEALVEQERQADSRADSVYQAALSDARWLRKRKPVAPYTSVMATHRDSKVPHQQAERAAVIASSAFAFRLALEAGTLEPNWIAGEPCCTWREPWLFNSVREPHPKCDKMVRYQGDYLVALRRGHAFKVMLRENGRNASLDELRAAFDRILGRVTDDGVWHGMLTTDERDSWATIREEVLALGPDNEKYFQVMDAAAFCICLDDTSPITPEERARDGYLGDGFNRWFDKVLQFVVTANGRSAVIMEHGIVDGLTLNRLSEAIAVAIDAYLPGPPVNGSSQEICVKEVALSTSARLDRHVAVLRARYAQNTASAWHKHVRLDEFGTRLLLQAQMPIKSVVDATFQLGVRLHFGRSIASWEAITISKYHQARTEQVQTVGPALVAFCDAAVAAYGDLTSGPTPQAVAVSATARARLRRLLLAASREMHDSMQTSLGGRSHARVMELLDGIWPSDDASAAKPQLLAGELFNGKPFLEVQSQGHEMPHDPIEDFVTIQPDKEIAYWAIIMPKENFIRISLGGHSEEGILAFTTQLHSAAKIMRHIVGEEMDPVLSQ